MFKRFGLWLSTSLFTISVLLLALFGTLLLLVNAPHVKKWFDKSGIYSSLPNSLINEAQKKQSKQPDAGATNFNEPGVQMAAKTALSPQFLRSSSETVIDSTFSWMRKDTPQPTFNIDLASAKQTFADKLAEYLQNRYEKLPACAPGTTPRSTEPFTIDCQPAPGFDVSSIIEIEKDKLLNNKDFLPESRLTAQTLGNSVDGKNLFERLSVVPRVYSLLALTPYLFAGLMFITSVGVLFLSESKKQGTRKIGWRLTIIGVLSLISGLLLTIGLIKIRSMATSQGNDAAVTIYKDALASGLNAVRNDMFVTGGIISGAILIFGVLLLVMTRDKKEKSTTDKTADIEEASTPPESKKEAVPQPPNPTVPTSAPALPKAPPAVATKPASKPKPRLIQ